VDVPSLEVFKAWAASYPRDMGLELDDL